MAVALTSAADMESDAPMVAMKTDPRIDSALKALGAPRFTEQGHSQFVPRLTGPALPTLGRSDTDILLAAKKQTSDSSRRPETLPPLPSRDRTFYLHNRHGKQMPFSETYLRHWNIQPPKYLRPGVDRKIVTHLRRSLNRRMEHRISSMLERVSDHTTRKDSGKAQPPPIRKPSPFNLFRSYNEFGEKVALAPGNFDLHLPSSKTPIPKIEPTPPPVQLDKVDATFSQYLAGTDFVDDFMYEPVAMETYPEVTKVKKADESGDDRSSLVKDNVIVEPESSQGNSGQVTQEMTPDPGGERSSTEVKERSEEETVFAMTERMDTIIPICEERTETEQLATMNQAAEHHGTGNQSAEHHGTGNQAAEHHGTGNKAAEHNGTGNQAAEHHGTGNQAAEHHGTGNQAAEHHGTGNQSAEHHGTGNQAAEHHGTGNQAAEHHGTGNQAAEHHGTGNQAAGHHGTENQAIEEDQATNRQDMSETDDKLNEATLVGCKDVELTPLDGGEEEEGDGQEGEAFPTPEHDHISPVATPLLYRPDTRYGETLEPCDRPLTCDVTERSRDLIQESLERAERVVLGDVTTRCQPKSPVFRVFFHSAGTDTEVERSAIYSKVYPKLREYCQSRGCDFQILDPQLGTRDQLLDDHTEGATAAHLLKRAKIDSKGFHFVTFLSQKYGDVRLPSVIPVDEYNAILDRIMADFEHQMALVVNPEKEKLAEDVLPPSGEGGTKPRPQSPISNYTVPDESVPVSPTKPHTLAPPGVPGQLATPGVEGHTPTSERKGWQRMANLVGKPSDDHGNYRRTRQGSVVLKAMKGAYSSPEVALAEPNLLRNWYKLDSNAVPPVYTLLNISHHYKEITAKDASRRSQARSNWVNTSRRLHKMLYHYAKLCFTDPGVLDKYNCSATETELAAALPSGEIGHWFRRVFEDWEVAVNDRAAVDYFDLVPMAPMYDLKAQDKLRKLTAEILQKKLPRSSIKEYSVNWHPEGISTATTRKHMMYVDTMCRDFLQTAILKVDEYLWQINGSAEMENKLYREIQHHVHYVRERAHGFHGRKDLLQAIKKHVRCCKELPLVVHGKSGCGMTSLLAKAARESHKWLKVRGATIVVMIGVTGQSTSIRSVLRSVCLQLARIYGEDTENVPSDYKGLFNHFSYQLSVASVEKPVIIFLDSLHKLSDENEARKLSWLPKEVPAHAHLIISTLSDEKYDCFSNLQKAFKKSSNFLEITPMPVEDASVILEHWYRRAGRRVTKQQMEYILASFDKCPQPLYLKLVFDESLHWASSLEVSSIRLGTAVKSVAMVIFGRLELVHGEPLVRRALGYLTASRSGVSETELEDLLSLDEAVMDDIFSRQRALLRRIPPVQWLRLRQDLTEYVYETPANGVSTLVWRHQQFSEAAEERYLLQRDKAASYHRAMAEYFKGTWADSPKPCQGHDKGLHRYVIPQPLSRELPTPDAQNTTVYNLRKLNELPYHLLNSQQMKELKRDCLVNFEFVLAKISAMGLRSFYEDMQIALAVEPNDLDLTMLSETLQLSSRALWKDPKQLASQVIGRLYDIIRLDTNAHGDPPKYPYLHQFFADARSGSVPVLVPSMTCLSPPGGVLFDFLSGHTEPITAVAMTVDGQRCVTSAKDNKMKVWELRTGRVVRTVAGVGADVYQISLGAHSTIAVTSETPRCHNIIRVWDLKVGECLKVIAEYDDPAAITTGDGSYLAAFFHGRLTMCVWSLQGDFDQLVETPCGEEGYEPVHKDNTTVVAHNAAGQNILHAYRSSSMALARNYKTGKIAQHLRVKDSGSISAVGVSRDYYILATRCQYMEQHEVCVLELFDVKDGKHVRSVKGCEVDQIGELFINNLGSHALAVSTSEATRLSSIATWNLETEEHKHLAKHAKVAEFGAFLDLRYCLTAAQGEETLAIWNLTGKINLPVPKEKPPAGIEHISPMVHHSRYVVAQAENNGPLSVWNIVKGGSSGKPVHIERGLVGSQDTMLVRNTKIYVLSEKGVPSSTENGSAVYQQLMIYNLQTKKYIHKIKDLFIVPCPRHEYVLLDDWHLMGLSDHRNHFIVWDLKSGHIAYRIKCTLFKAKAPLVAGPERGKEERKLVHKSRGNTAKMTPWDRRQETKSAKKRRHLVEDEEDTHRITALKHEKENSMDQFLLSEDQTTVVASYFAHHICVFDLPSRSHLATLENPSSMLHLYVSALTPSGGHLVQTNYDDDAKSCFITLWDCRAGRVRRRLRKERNVAAIAISENAQKVVLGRACGDIRLWEPGKAENIRTIGSYKGLKFGVESQIRVTTGGRRAVVFSGEISVWDLDRAMVLAIFTPDQNLSCFTLNNQGDVIVFGMRDSADVVTLRLKSRDEAPAVRVGEDMFGEPSSSDSDNDVSETASKMSTTKSSLI